MKILHAFILLILLAGCGPSSAFIPSTKFPKTVHLLIAGQSNGNSNLQDSALQVSLSQHEVPYAPPSSNAVINIYSTSTAYFTPTPANPSKFGMAWLNLASFAPDHNFIISVESCAGTSTQQQVERGYYQFIAKALMAAHYDAILWVQGEADSGLGLSEDTTYNNMVFIINTSRLAQPDIVWYVALDSSRGFPDNNPTRNAQRRIIRDGYALQGPDVDTMRSNTAFVEATGAEFSGAGLREHGRLWYEALKSRL